MNDFVRGLVHSNVSNLILLLGYLEAYAPDEGYTISFGDNLEAAKGGEKVPPKYADGSFRKRKNGLLEYRFMHLDNQISVYGKSEDACFDKRTAIVSGKTKSKKKITKYSEWLENWFNLYKKPYNGERSLKDITSQIDNKIIPNLGKSLISKLKREELQEFINKYSATANAQKKLYDVLNGSLKMAVSHGLIKYNPAQGLILAAHSPKHYRALEFDEQLAIYNAIKLDKYKRLFMFCCCTGIRIGRVLALEVACFDKERMLIKVFRKQKKGLNEYYAVPYLDELLELPKQGKVFAGITYNGARQYFDNVFEKLKIQNANIHSFKHTFVSVLHHLGVDDKQIQLWAGHKTLAMTTDIYTKLLEKGSSPILEYLTKLAP